MTGNLNWTDFQTEARKFLQLSDKFQDGWKILYRQGDFQDSGEPILYMEKLCLLPDHVEKVVTSEEDDQSDDDKEFKISENRTFLRATYHIVYSHSYQVPVLYFKFVRSDGRPLSLEELWQRVPDTFQIQLESQKWSMLTQQEHPLLGLPFNCLHPCHTEALMKSTTDNLRRIYLVTWLSSVGPVIGLNLRLEYATQ